MTDLSFFDRNILIYTDDHDAPEKQSRALQLIERARRTNTGFVSTQVLQEYFVTTTRKLGLPVDIARRKVELFAHLNLVQIDVENILSAIDLHRLYGFSFWDALIVNCALQGGCNVLVTEDLQHGQQVNGLEIRNPFR